MGILRERMIEEMKLRNFSPQRKNLTSYAVTRLQVKNVSVQFHLTYPFSSI
jgi:hypothetical protein